MRTPPRLSLSLVDWHTEQAKFDDGPYVATILGLDWAISSALGAKPISDYTDYRAIRRQLRALSHSLAIDLATAGARLADLEVIQLRPFYYSDDPENDELGVIANAFQKVWNPTFVRILTQFAPYAELLAFRRQQGSFSLDFVNWYQLRYKHKQDSFAGKATDEYRKLLGRLSARTTNPLGENALEEMLDQINQHKNGNLAFNVVFQRALFMAFDEIQKIRGDHLQELIDSVEDDYDLPDFEEEDDSDEDEETGSEIDDEEEAIDVFSHRATHVNNRSEQFTRHMNSLIAAIPEFLDVEFYFFEEGSEERERFWLGTLWKREGGIDFTQGASTRATEILFWAVSMQMYDEIVEPDDESDFGEFWAAVLEGDNSLTRRIYRSIRRFSDREISAGGRILRADEEDFSVQASREEARKRVEWIWNRLGL